MNCEVGTPDKTPFFLLHRNAGRANKTGFEPLEWAATVLRPNFLNDAERLNNLKKNSGEGYVVRFLRLDFLASRFKLPVKVFFEVYSVRQPRMNLVFIAASDRWLCT